MVKLSVHFGEKNSHSILDDTSIKGGSGCVATWQFGTLHPYGLSVFGICLLYVMLVRHISTSLGQVILVSAVTEGGAVRFGSD